MIQLVHLALFTMMFLSPCLVALSICIKDSHLQGADDDYFVD